MIPSECDVAVIGGGPGGYVCAIQAAKAGMKVVCVEKRVFAGGTCLNVGCIPSKALLHVSEHAALLKSTEMSRAGISVSGVKVDFAAMHEYKRKIIQSNAQGIDYLFKKNGVVRVQGEAVFHDSNILKITDASGRESMLSARNIVIATGSVPAPVKGIEADEKYVLTSTGALDLETVPERAVVVGAGAIGLEIGSVWQRLGADVTVLEYMPHMVSSIDRDIAAGFQKVLKSQGMKLMFGRSVIRADRADKGVNIVHVPAGGNGAEEICRADVCLIAVGRRPYTDGLCHEKAGISLDSRGRIPVDSYGRTSVPGVYAIGDVTEGPMLAHKAEEEGIAVAQTIAGKPSEFCHDLIPSVIYTAPEVASVGMTEQDLEAQGRPFRSGVFSLQGNGRAKVVFHSKGGMAKIIVDKDTDRILGAHILSPCAGEMIHECCVAMDFGASAADLACVCHAHPTLSEAVREAALQASSGATLHS